MAADWAPNELAGIAAAEELQLATNRADGSLSKYTTMWVVRAGDHLYVRSAHGYENPWFQRALGSGAGRIRAGGVERDVRFQVPDPDAADKVSVAYHVKYDRYGPRIVGTVVSPDAVRSTLRLEIA
jgi:hypothetical protein